MENDKNLENIDLDSKDSKDETKLISLFNNVLNPVNIKIAQKEALM